MSTIVRDPKKVFPHFKKLIDEVAREALLELRGDTWRESRSCNERRLGARILFTDFLGERALCSDQHNLKVTALLGIIQPALEPVTEGDSSLHYFIDYRGEVSLQTVPYPYGLRQLDGDEIGQLVERISTERAV